MLSFLHGGCPRLETLDLDSNMVGSRGARVMADAFTSGACSELQVRGMTPCSRRGVLVPSPGFVNELQPASLLDPEPQPELDLYRRDRDEGTGQRLPRGSMQGMCVARLVAVVAMWSRLSCGWCDVIGTRRPCSSSSSGVPACETAA